MKKFSEQLVEQISAQNLTIEKVAQAAGINPSAVRDYVEGRNLPAKKRLAAIEEVLGHKFDIADEMAQNAADMANALARRTASIAARSAS